MEDALEAHSRTWSCRSVKHELDQWASRHAARSWDPEADARWTQDRRALSKFLEVAWAGIAFRNAMVYERIVKGVCQDEELLRAVAVALDLDGTLTGVHALFDRRARDEKNRAARENREWHKKHDIKRRKPCEE